VQIFRCINYLKEFANLDQQKTRRSKLKCIYFFGQKNQYQLVQTNLK